MTTNEIFRLKAQVSVLCDVAQHYSGRTIENIISNIEARINVLETMARKEDGNDANNRT